MTKKTPIRADYHIHTPYCGHAHGNIIDYVEAAITKGLKEICFTDHLGRYYLGASQKRRYRDWGMDRNKLARYVNELEHVKETYKDAITIRMGLEIDYIAGAEDMVGPLIAPYSFDYLLGSIHCIPTIGWKHLSHYSTDDTWVIFDEYFKAVKSLFASKLFDGLAHIDFIWRYIKWPKRRSKRVLAYIDEIIAAAQEFDMTIEINSNGYLWSQIYTIEEGDPFTTLLASLNKYNVPVTIGSDAHGPEFVSKVFVELAEVLKGNSITHYCTFDNHQRSLHKIG